MNYANLQTKVASWLNRSDLADNIPDFLSLAHDRIFVGTDNIPALRCPVNEKVASYTLDDTNFIDLPADYLEANRLTVNGVPFYRGHPDSLKANEYARDGSHLVFANAQSGEVQLSYWYACDFPTSGDDENPVMALSWGLYLYGALCEASPFLLDDARLAVWEAKYKQTISGINKMARRAEMS